MDERELRVAIYSSNFFRHDGVTVTCRRIITELKQRGAAVRVLTCVPAGGVPESEPLITAEEVIVIPPMPFPMPSFTESSDSAEFDGYVMGSSIPRASKALLADFAPNIMHVTAPDGGGLAAAVWARRTPGVGLLCTWHSNFQDYVLHYPLSWLTRPIVIFWMRLYCAPMPLTLVPTASVRDELARLGFRRMSVWGRGVDPSVFTPHARSASCMSSHGCWRCCCA